MGLLPGGLETAEANPEVVTNGTADGFKTAMNGGLKMTYKNITLPHHISFQQKIEGMPIVFNPDTVQDLKATIQFNVSGQEMGFYYLKIDSGNYTFSRGKASNPSMFSGKISKEYNRENSQASALQDLYPNPFPFDDARRSLPHHI